MPRVRLALSSLAQIRTLSVHLFSTENLYIYEDLYSPEGWYREHQMVGPSTSIYGREESLLAPRIAPALQELMGGRTTEVLPNLQNLFLDGFQPPEPVPESIGLFISARRLTNHPVAISILERDSEKEWSSEVG
jgi:hypothetical protein